MARVELALPDHFPFTTELPVRVTDLNYGGHVGNDVILQYVHEARARFLLRHDLTELDIDGLGIIVADAVVVYRAESFFGDRLQINVAAKDFNRYGCDFVYRIDRASDGREIARAKTGIVFFDYHARRIARAPERFRLLFDAE
ncbi:MAG: thioesterase family protein [Ectothiorhodospiraceae bacterium]|jgi:acyl-CoA thioesterase FadM